MTRLPTKTVQVSNQLGGAIFMFVGLIILGCAGFQIYRIWQFSGQSQQVSGIIDRRFIEYGHKRAIPTVQYHYSSQGEFHAATTEVSRTTWGQLREGGTVPVKYLLNQPSKSRINLQAENQMAYGNAETTSLIGLFVFGFASFIFFLKGKSSHA